MKILLILLLIVGCSHSSKISNKIPDWVKNPYNSYPEKEYLAVVGVGDSQKDALNMAYSKISNIFGVDVKANSRVIQEYRQIISSKSEVYEKNESSSDVSVKSTHNLLNVNYGENYSSKDGRVFQLAYIERKSTAKIYREIILSNQHSILFYLNNKQTNLIMEYSFLKAALTISTVNQSLINQLKIIYPKEKIKLDYSHFLIKTKVAQLINNIGFSIKSEKKVETIINKIINSLGFPITKEPVFEIFTDVKIKKSGLIKDGQIFLDWNLSLKLVDEKSRIIFSTFEKGREGGINRVEAENKTYFQIEKRLKTKIEKELRDYFLKNILSI